MTDLAPRTSVAPAGAVRLLHGVGAQPVTLTEHRATYPAPDVAWRPGLELVDAVERSGLRGRGGAAFPTSFKLRAVLASPGVPVVVINGTEGEPLSSKDALLSRFAPHLVLDGAVVAAAMVGATEVHVALDRADDDALIRIDHAILERRSAGEALAATSYTRPTPSRYVAGEETALIRHLDGGPALPTAVRIRPYQKGVAGRPTLVLNTETAAHLAQIAQWGPDWFREQGTPAHAGTTLVTVSGASRPGVYEVPLGTPLARVASTAGGLRSRPEAVLVGGYFGTWIGGDIAPGVGLSNEQLQPLGAAVGCGAVTFLPAGACGLYESARALRWMAGQTAGQCGPCVHGMASLAATLSDVADGSADQQAVARLHHWAGQIEGRGACRFPDGAIRFLRSALHVFAEDVRRHQAGRVCPPPKQALLPTPRRGER